MMQTPYDAKELHEMATNTETTDTELERLAGCGFSCEEIVSLLWLRQWYQTGGSDRIALLGVPQVPCSHWQAGRVGSTACARRAQTMLSVPR